METRVEPSVDEFDALMDSRGWVLFPHVLKGGEIEALCRDCDAQYENCRAVQVKNGVAENMEGTAHHLVGYGGPLDDFLRQFPLESWIDRHFGGKWTVLNYGAALNPPGSRAYLAKPHRDVRAFTPGYNLSLNMLVMLGDFTPETGATLILSGSHRHEEMPTLEHFEQHAAQIVGVAGDIVLFNSLTVHAASPNLSEVPRRALTLCLGRPFMKPQMDWPRYLSARFQAQMTPKMRQLLGFNARVATSLEEYYQPPDRWVFKPDQL